MNGNPIDLHCHSTASDGALPAAELVARAAGRGGKVLAVTDHDCLVGLPAAHDAAQQLDVHLLPGVEISVTWNKHTLHILGLGIDPDNAQLQTGLSHIRHGRVERARRMAASLAQVGVMDTFVGAMALCANPEMIGRTHFARFLVESGQVRNVQSVFRKYLAKGKPGYVPHEWARLEDVLGWIHAAGGLAVIAHPGRYDLGTTSLTTLFTEFKALGGDAIEVVSGSHTQDQTLKFALHAQHYGFLASAGSDFHAPGEGGRDVGWTAALPPICQPIWAHWGLTGTEPL